MSKTGRGAKITEDQLRDEWAALNQGPERIPSAGKTIKQLMADWGMSDRQVRVRVDRALADGKINVIGIRPNGKELVYDMVRP